MLNIHISGKSVKSVFSATLLRVLFKQSVMTASYLIKHLCLREIRWIRVFRHHVKSVSVSSQSCLQVLSLNIQVLKSVFSATLFKSFSVYEIHPSSQSFCIQCISFPFKELLTTHGKDGFYGFCGAMELRVRTFSFFFRFRQLVFTDFLETYSFGRV